MRLSKSEKKIFSIIALYEMEVAFEIEAKSLTGAKMKVTRALKKGKSLSGIAKEIDWSRESLISYEIEEE